MFTRNGNGLFSFESSTMHWAAPSTTCFLRNFPWSSIRTHNVSLLSRLTTLSQPLNYSESNNFLILITLSECNVFLWERVHWTDRTKGPWSVNFLAYIGLHTTELRLAAKQCHTHVPTKDDVAKLMRIFSKPEDTRNFHQPFCSVPFSA